VLERHGLIRYHTVERPFAKDSLMHWTHWAAAIKETANGERFAVDSSAGANGENPTVQAAASFYVLDAGLTTRRQRPNSPSPVPMAGGWRKEPTA